MKRLILLFSLGFLFVKVHCQMFSPQQMKDDLKTFRTALELKHPEMYRYTSRQQFDKLFEETEASLNDSMDLRGFYTKLNPLVVALHCGHTKWFIPGKDAYYPFFETDLFPLSLYFVGDKVFATGSRTETDLTFPLELKSINGKHIGDIREKLLSNLTFADGYSLEGKYYELNNFFPGIYSTYYGTSPEYTIDYLHDGTVKTHTLPGTSLENIHIKDKQEIEGPLHFEIVDGSTAWIKIDRFFTMKGEPHFKKFLKESFREINSMGIRNLVLDLRGNEGGNENLGIELYRHLASKPFKYYEKITVRPKQKSDIKLNGPLLFRVASLFNKKENGETVFTLGKGLRTGKPFRNAYQGKTFILLDGQSYSVATEFASRAKSDGRAIMIGTETGGGYALNTSGFFAVMNLPNSRIELGIPLLGFHMSGVNGSNPVDRGILPDHYIKPGPQDIITGKDPVKEYTLNLIRTSQETKTESVLIN
jgi:C-terminal processing protease CtpA/Prc